MEWVFFPRKPKFFNSTIAHSNEHSNMMSYTYSVVISKASSKDASTYTHATMFKNVMLYGDDIPVLLLTQGVLTFNELDTVFRYSV